MVDTTAAWRVLTMDCCEVEPMAVKWGDSKACLKVALMVARSAVAKVDSKEASMAAQMADKRATRMVAL